MTPDQQYTALLHELLTDGERVRTRNDWVRRLICRPLTFTGTPLVCARKTAWRNALLEWEWFMSGSNNVKDLHPAARPWWQPWANEEGFVFFNYSRQFREFEGASGHVDQIALLIDGVKNHPFSRRNVITTWNAADMNHPLCPISNCHNSLTQAFVDGANALHLVTYQRSVDVVCGVVHNWIQEWAFLLWLASRTGRGVGSLTWIGGDVHLYEEHAELAQKVVDVAHSEPCPELAYAPTCEEFRAEDFRLDRPYLPRILDRARMIV